jgi:hypothetical protein
MARRRDVKGRAGVRGAGERLRNLFFFLQAAIRRRAFQALSPDGRFPCPPPRGWNPLLPIGMFSASPPPLPEILRKPGCFRVSKHTMGDPVRSVRTAHPDIFTFQKAKRSVTSSQPAHTQCLARPIFRRLTGYRQAISCGGELIPMFAHNNSHEHIQKDFR